MSELVSGLNKDSPWLSPALITHPSWEAVIKFLVSWPRTGLGNMLAMWVLGIL